ncbi:MAG: hypothetical protein V1704_03015 [Candidatus Vogelbacteria bacterium]
MILATHAITSAALAALMPDQPILAFTAGVASHFLLDAIPHWDYDLRSSRKDENNPLNNDMIIGRDFWFDLIKLGADTFLGLALGWLFFHQFFLDHGSLGLLTFAAGAIGGLLPDALQFAYFKLRPPAGGWLTALQRFHYWIHADQAWKLKPLVGIVSQTLLVATIILTVKIIL